VLGSTRVVTRGDGNVRARYDYLPYGEEIEASKGGRTEVAGYGGADTTRQKFTTYERDSESGLDYFLARYYSSAQGRFTSVDPENAGAIGDDPQSWNGYAYARNNPLLFSDPNGETYVVCSDNGCGEINDDAFYAERKKYEALGFTFTGNRDFFEGGNIISPDGQVVAQYQQTEIDLGGPNDRARYLSYELRERFNDPSTYVKAAVGMALGRALRSEQKFIPTPKRFSQADRLSRAAAAPDRGGFTVAGRSLTKHGVGARSGNSKFSVARGNPSQVNQQAQDIVDDILTNPGTTVTQSYRGRFGNTIEYTAPDGRGLVFSANGKFLFFKE
jgi:RHS repeat-associated protein